MKIIEEFIKRKKLSHIPIVHHTNYGFFILKPNLITSDINYLCLKINWNDKSKGPGNYTIQSFTFRKFNADYNSVSKLNTYIDRSFIYNTLSSNTIDYEDYESYVFSWFDKLKSSSFNYKTPNNSQETYFMLWECFVFIFESYFSTENKIIKDLVWESINDQSSESIRFKHIENILHHLYTNFYSLYYVWNIDITHMINSYSPWMNNLFQNIFLKKMILN